MPATPVVKGLGEIVLRVKNLERMKTFYQEVLCLPVMAEFEDWIFFKVGHGHEGHSRVVALVKESWPPNIRGMKRDPVDGRATPLHHFALEISLSDYDTEKQRLETMGHKVTTATYTWCHWRSLYVEDPEGNIVELVTYDASVE